MVGDGGAPFSAFAVVFGRALSYETLANAPATGGPGTEAGATGSHYARRRRAMR